MARLFLHSERESTITVPKIRKTAEASEGATLWPQGVSTISSLAPCTTGIAAAEALSESLGGLPFVRTGSGLLGAARNLLQRLSQSLRNGTDAIARRRTRCARGASRSPDRGEDF